MSRHTTDFYLNSGGYETNLDLFGESIRDYCTPPGVSCARRFLTDHHSLFRLIHNSVTWKTRHRTRESVSWGESCNYHTGERKSYPLPTFLLPVMAEIEKKFGFPPNNCVANRYQNGDNTIGFHSDEDMLMRGGTGVVIVSLGHLRHIVLRRIDRPQVRFHYALEPGSALHMTDASQSEWQHGILREAGAGTRISLSFRCLE